MITYIQIWRLRRIARAAGKILNHAIALEDVSIINAIREFNLVVGERLKLERKLIERKIQLNKLRREIQ